MTKQIKLGLLLFIIIAVGAGIYAINSLGKSNSTQAGYDLYQQGDSKAAFEQFSKMAATDSQSAYALAMMYMNGVGTQADENEAIKWLIQSAQNNNKHALYNLGYYRYHHKTSDTPEDKRGLVSLAKSADLGLKEAQEMLGKIYADDEYKEIPQNIKLARKYFTLAAEQDSRLAKLTLGYIAHHFDKNNKKAVEILTPLISTDFPFPAMLLGTIYEEGGNGVAQNKLLAKKYQNMATASIMEFDTEQFESAPLSIYGSQTDKEKQQIIANLEAQAHRGNEAASYILFQKYMIGEDVPKSTDKAVSYLDPLIDKKVPKALYLNYLATKTNFEGLVEAADSNDADAMYLLYQVYSQNLYDPNVDSNEDLADKYFKAAADAGHHKALVEMIHRAISNYNFPNRKLEGVITKYMPILMEKYSNFPDTLLIASEVYGNQDSSLYSPEKSFQTLNEANKKSPSYDSKIKLADKYAHGIGVEQNLAKAVTLLKECIEKDRYPASAESLLVNLYYQYDIRAWVEEKQIIDILKKDIEKSENYQQAHYYAQYLLQQDPVKKRKEAFELYQKASGYTYNARIYYAAALLEYQPNKEKQVAELVTQVLNTPQAKASLSKKELADAYAILFKTAVSSPDAKELVVKLALYDKNSDALKLIEPLIGIDADITYQYGIKMLSQITDIDNTSDAEIKPYYEAILKAVDLGSTQAHLYIAQNIDSVNYISDKPYYKARFQALTGLSINDLISQYTKCADLGSNHCLYELGEIYQEGKYGEDANYETALTYYNKISDPDFSFLKSRLREIEQGKARFIEIQAAAKQNDSDALRTLAEAYKYGSYGQKINQATWLKYLAKSAKLNNENALEELVDYYSQDELIDSNKAKILGYYNQLAAIGSENYTRELAHQYLNGSRLVEPNRQKAREYYIKAGSYGKQYLGYMNTFDTNMKVVNESPAAQHEVGYAYLYGHGIKKDIHQAIKHLKKASEQGNDQAILRYSEMLYMGVYDDQKQQWAMEPNWDAAVTLMKKHSKLPNYMETNLNAYENIVKPAQKGDIKAYVALGDWYKYYGNYPAAKIWYNKSIDAGNLEAYSLLDSAIEDKDTAAKHQLYLAGAEKGDLYSKMGLARIYLNDANIALDSEQYKLALQYLKDAMKSDRKEVSDASFTLLANLYHYGIKDKKEETIRSKDMPQYLALIESEANNRTEALKRLYTYYANNDTPKALGYLQRAYEQGDLEAIKEFYQLNYPGEYCSNSRNADIDESATYLTEWLLKKNFPVNEEQHYIGIPEQLTKEMAEMYRDGSCDVEKDLDKAIKWYKASLNYNSTYALDDIYKAYVLKGDAKEAYYYALLLKESLDNFELLDKLSASDKVAVEARFTKEQEYQKYGRFAKEIEEKRKKAEAGDGIEAFSLGVSYAHGEHVPEDTQKMLYYYELAGKNGYSRAYNILGNLYRKDNEQDIKKDAQKALYYFDLGAQQKDSNTAHLAGDMLYFGQGLEKDYPRAAKYYDMTDLEQGNHHAMAKYKLAYMYYNGLVGTKSKEDIQKAYDYLEIGAKYQDKDSIKALREWDFSHLNAK